METYYILHLAASWRAVIHSSPPTVVPPLSTVPVSPSISSAHPPSTQRIVPGASTNVSDGDKGDEIQPSIKAAAVHMVFASRTSQDFITPTQVDKLEAWCGRAVLEALINFEIPDAVR